MISIYFAIFAIIVCIVAWAIIQYNTFIKYVIRIDNAWSDINVQFKRRYDLIPNLVNTVKGYATHEKSTLTDLTEARAKAIKSEGIQGQAQSENFLTDALKSVFAVAEAYPDLKANANFIELQKELVDTEDKIKSARRFYNNCVKDLNINVNTFPANILAKVFNFVERDFFKLDNADKAAKDKVEVKF